MIERFEIWNGGPFRGHHVVELGAGAYALTARSELDPRRSNAIGKSFFLELISYALNGTFRRERGFDVDGWITRGEREGKTILTLAGGAKVERWKRVGQARQLRVTLPGRGEAAQDEAQALLYKWLAFDARDYRHAAYFEQREMARLVHMDPGERLSVVVGWLGLGAGEKAAKGALDLAGERSADVARAEAKRDTLREIAERGCDDEGETPEAMLARAGEAERRAGEIERRARQIQQLRRAAEVVDAQERRLARVRKLRAATEDESPITAATEADAKLAAVGAVKIEAIREVDRRRVVATGQFDGQCPIAGLTCPAKAAINADRATATKELKKAEAALSEARGAHAEAVDASETLLDARAQLLGQRAELKRLVKEVRENADAAGSARQVLEHAPAEEPGELEECVAEERENRREAHALTERARMRRENAARVDRAAKDLAGATEDAARHAAVQKRAMTARAVIRAAQRRVAERAIGAVEASAGAIIADAGVDLSVRARWEREGKGPASVCEECGAAFPSSAKVKECTRCGSPRGVVTEQRLDLVLSDSSGAYDDLAGVAWQLAAGAWLLDSRESPWSTAILDEPFAHADPVVRHGMARCLARLVAVGAYRQMIIVSHTGDTVGMLPHRITVVMAADGARRIEVA